MNQLPVQTRSDPMPDFQPICAKIKNKISFTTCRLLFQPGWTRPSPLNIIWLRAAYVTERFLSLVSLIFSTSGVGVSDLWTSSPSLPMSLTLPSPPSSSLPEADFFFLSFRRFLRRKPKEKIK